MKDGNELWHALRQHIGSQTLFHHSLVKSFTYTEGVRDFARNAGNGAYWLLDILATEPAVRGQVFQNGFASAKLRVNADKRSGVLWVEDGNNGLVFEHVLDCTDCPAAPVKNFNPRGDWTFFIEPNQFENGSMVMTMMLPWER